MYFLTKHSTANNTVLKIITAVLFISLPFLGFFLGMKYQESTSTSETAITSPVRKPTPTAVDTSNWKTFTDTKEGFSLQYPPNAVEGTKESNTFPVAKEFHFSEPRKGGGGGPFETGWSIFISKTQANPRNLTLREWGKEKEIIYGKDNAIDPKYINIKDTFLGRLPAISWEINGGDLSATEYLVKRANGVTFITVSGYMYEKITNQILSTFKFTDQTQTTDTSNWKTYINKKSNFEIKYPPNWYLNQDILSNYEISIKTTNNTPYPIVKCDFIDPPLDFSDSKITNIGTIPSLNSEITINKEEFLHPQSFVDTITTYIFSQQNKKRLALRCFYLDDSLKSQLNEILSTLKFTN